MTAEGRARQISARVIGPDRDEDREEDDRGLGVGVEDIGVGVEDICDAEEAPDINLPEDHLRQVGRHSLTLAVDAAYQDVEQVASVGYEEGGVRDPLVCDLVGCPEEVDCCRSVEDAAQGEETVSRHEVRPLPGTEEGQEAEDDHVDEVLTQQKCCEDQAYIERAEDGSLDEVTHSLLLLYLLLGLWILVLVPAPGSFLRAPGSFRQCD